MFKIPATIACILLILYALRLDRRWSRELSPGLWIPTLWLMIVASKPVSQWLNLASTNISVEDVETGSPIDRFAFLILIMLAITCLSRRDIQWSKLIENNKALVALILFAGVSVLWSEFPFVSFKRWGHGLGAVLAALIVATEKNYMDGIQAVIRRTAFIFLPLSFLFIKYYRHIGVGYSPWGGEAMMLGVTNNKNSLGRLCLISALLFTYLLWSKRKNLAQLPAASVIILYLYLALSVVLLIRSNSATSLMSVIIGAIVFLGFRTLGLKGRHAYLVLFLILPACLLVLSMTNGVSYIVYLLDRDTTLTGRTELWSDLLQIRGNLLLGTGYGAFWLGDRLAYFWSQDKYWWSPTTAHNGYLEVVLQLGVLGLSIFLGFLFSSLSRIRAYLEIDENGATFLLSIFIVFIFYNVTESATSFRAMLFYVLLLVTVGLPARVRSTATSKWREFNQISPLNP